MVLEGGVVVPENTFKTVDEQNPEQAEPYKCDTCLSCKKCDGGRCGYVFTARFEAAES